MQNSRAAAQRGNDMTSGRPPRILIADDDADLRAELASSLQMEGFQVMEAADGNELLEAVVRAVGENGEAAGVDAIVTDVMMPGFSGLDVLTAIRSRAKTIPILVITGFGDERLCRKAESLGAVTVFRKPFDVHRLGTALREALRHVHEAQPERQA